MTGSNIQEHFGNKVIEAFANFAREDLDTPEDLEADSFAHITDQKLRKELAQVFYGARWLYKLGLALLAKNEEKAAHVRAQIVDYAAVSEALLSFCISHAIANGYAQGANYQFSDPGKNKKPISWNMASPERQVAKRSMWWLVAIGHEFGIINSTLKKDVDWLREQRNTVHLRARAALGPTAFLNQSMRAFEATTSLVSATKRWMAAHP
ncbi:MAG: hypothetical protein ACWGG5_05030 [Stenotrophomonas sp.]